MVTNPNPRQPPVRSRRGLWLACGLGLLVAWPPAGASRAGESGFALDPTIVAGRKWEEGATQYRRELLSLAETPELPPPKALADLYAKYSLCRLLAASGSVDLATDPERGDLVDWLLAQPALAAKLALALNPRDNLLGVLSVLRILMLATGRRTAAAEDLYVAFAVVWDGRTGPGLPGTGEYVPGGTANRGPDDADSPEERLRRLFLHFAGNWSRMSAPLGSLPWQLLIHVADLNISDSDRRWAFEHYARHANYGALYGSILYDIERRKWKAGAPYTLENIRRWGGVCGDRTYFTSNVAKSCGRPAIAVSGATRIGVSHAWVLVLHTSDTGTHCWTIHGWPKGEPGDYTDPQTRARVPLQDAILQARALSAPPADRLAAETDFRVAELFRSELDTSRTLELLERSLRQCPYDRRPWLMLAEMMAQGQAASEKASDLYRFLLAKFRNFPEFTCAVLHTLLPLIPEDEPQRLVRLYEATFKVYWRDPDIVAKLMTELGDALRDRDMTRAALYTYREVVPRFRAQAQRVEGALKAAEPLCRQEKALPLLIAMYEDVYRLYRFTRDDGLYYGMATYYYRFAKKLEALYTETRDFQKAAEYRRRAQQIEDAMAKREERSRKRNRRD